MTEAYEQFSSSVSEIQQAQQAESERLEREIEEARAQKLTADNEAELATNSMQKMRELFGLN